MKRRFLLALFGVAGGLLFLEGALRIAPRLMEPTVSGRGSIEVLALGESTTQGGEWGGESYPRHLSVILNRSCAHQGIQVRNAGIAGARSTDVYLRMRSELERLPPDSKIHSIALIMLGINDIQGGGRGVTAVGKSPFRIVRAWNWIVASLEEGRKPSPVPEHADELGKLDRWDYYRAVTQPLFNANHLAELEAVHRAVLKLHPENHAAKIDLGSLLRAKGDVSEALRWHLAAIDEAPEDPWPVWEAAQDYAAMGNWPQALHGADILIKLGAKLPLPLVTSLAAFLEKNGYVLRRDKLLDAAVKRETAQAILQWLIASAREKSGRQTEAEAARAKAEASASAPYPAVLAANYKAIVRELNENGVRVFALSYPRQPVAPLAALFPNQEVELVSLEEPFNEAVKKEGYAAIFTDSFGGNFGHLTSRGNELLASVVAPRLLQLPEVVAACEKGKKQGP